MLSLRRNSHGLIVFRERCPPTGSIGVIKTYEIGRCFLHLIVDNFHLFAECQIQKFLSLTVFLNLHIIPWNGTQFFIERFAYSKLTPNIHGSILFWYFSSCKKQYLRISLKILKFCILTLFHCFLCLNNKCSMLSFKRH